MIVLVSGGFDPLHVGHLNLLEAAAEHGDVLVALNSDQWLIRKKGYLVMPYEDRARILLALKVVRTVSPVDDHDGTVCAALAKLRPHVFANGGDRTEANPAEHALCEKLGIKEIFGVGGGKARSSSDLVNAAIFDCTGLRPS